MNQSYQFILKLFQGYQTLGPEGRGDVSPPQSHKKQQMTPELRPGENNFHQCSLHQVSRLSTLRKESSLQSLKQFSISSFFDRVIVNKRSW